MFRKPKRKADKGNLRSKTDYNAEDVVTTNETIFDVVGAGHQQNDGSGDEIDTIQLLNNTRKRVRNNLTGVTASTSTNKANAVLHSYQSSQNDNDRDGTKRQRDLITSTVDHHPTNKIDGTADVGFGEDGIFRNQKQNKFHAGPIRAAAHVRVTARFDYQPDICKDYKETGFCGYGDTCIYLHDRGDTLSGWQIEQQWEQQQKLKKEQQEKEMYNFATNSQTNDTMPTIETSNLMNDGIPFACYLCRKPFTNPVATKCLHYFCESCIIEYIRGNDTVIGKALCPICAVDTGSVFNEPTKLLAKRRKVLGNKECSALDSNTLWKVFAEAVGRSTDAPLIKIT